MNPPTAIDGARVLRFVEGHPTFSEGRTRHVVEGREVTEFAALVIAKYDDGEGFYLFYCDEAWNAVTDTYHSTVEGAIAQAEYEFGPLEFAELV